jgi:hypothetical protein
LPSIAIIFAYDCTGKTDGSHHKDPDNPHKFYQCVGGKAVEFKCPEDLVFDETSKTCTFGGTPDPNATQTTHKVESTPSITPSTAGTTKPNTPSTAGTTKPSTPSTAGTTKPNTPSTAGTTKPNTPSTAGTTKPSTQSTPPLITIKETATQPNVTPTQSGTTAAQTTKGSVITTTQTATEAPNNSSTNTLRIRHTTPHN